jgi:hypothetical protein
MKNIFKIVFAILFLPLMVQAQPAPVKKAAQSVFTLTTYNADGTIHYTSHGVFTGNSGEAIAMWHPFQGAVKAVIIDAKGRQYDVDAMLGVSENYDVCRFRVKGYTNGSTALPLTTDNTAPSTVYLVGYDLKKPEIKSTVPVRTEKFMTTNNYYVFKDEDVSGAMLGCPVVNASGQLLGIVQRPDNGGEAFSTDARLTTTFKRFGLSISDQTFRATGIRTALPDDEKEASLMLVLAASMTDSLRYNEYIDDYIKYFPTATDGYNARATQMVNHGKLAEADEMLQTEVKHAAKKDVAYSNYAALVYNACVLRVDSAFTKWNLDKAYALAGEAYKLNPQPAYQHQQAQVLFAQKKYQEAADMLTALQNTDLGKTGEIYYETAQCKAQLKAPKEEVMALLDKAVNVQKGTASAPYVLARGMQYDTDGNYRKAFLDYLTYDSLMNNNASADFYYTKYKCEMKIRQYQPALNDIAHAIVLTRTEPLYYAEMASLQLRVNKLEDAVKTCDLALTIKGADTIPDLFIIKGVALCELKQKETGLEALKKAQELGDSRAEDLIKKYGK